MISQKLKSLLFVIVVVLTLLFVLFIPSLGYTDEGHTEAVPHNESSQVPVLPLTEDDDFVGDTHIDHTHIVTVNKPWYQNVQWWVMLIISLFLMALLSFGVYRYLQVKD